MSNMNFNTANQTLRQLLGNGLAYIVPRFQRDYSWTESEWDDLWVDIMEMYSGDGEPAHYMGYFVLQSSDSRNFEIIDGQQRITTLSIIILSALKVLKDLVKQGVDSDSNMIRAKQLRDSFIGYLDPVSLVSKSKVTLNRNNDNFYQRYLVPLDEIPKRGLKTSEKLLGKSFSWFYEKTKHELVNEKSGKKIAEFVETIADRLFFTVITVSDELNAFKVFETLNARGVRLSSTDLLKNYLFSVIAKEGTHETEIAEVEKQWEVIADKLGSESFPTFLRYFWNSYNKLVRKADLFKAIRNTITNKKEAFDLIRDLSKYADIYAALNNPSDEFWKDNSNSSCIKYINELKMFNVKQPLSMLMAAYDRFDETSFEKLLRLCSIISFRYNVIGGLNPNDQEKVYNKAAVAISSNDASLIDIKSILTDKIYPDDDSFKSAFTAKELRTSNSRNNKIARYILFSIESHMSKSDYDAESERYTIEHILPDNPGEEWPDYDEQRDGPFIYRLGNFTLLDKTKNRDIGNADFKDKCNAYKDSEFVITKKISEDYLEWNAEKIIHRQTWMAKQALAIWRINT